MATCCPVMPGQDDRVSGRVHSFRQVAGEFGQCVLNCLVVPLTALAFTPVSPAGLDQSDLAVGDLDIREAEPEYGIHRDAPAGAVQPGFHEGWRCGGQVISRVELEVPGLDLTRIADPFEEAVERPLGFDMDMRLGTEWIRKLVPAAPVTPPAVISQRTLEFVVHRRPPFVNHAKDGRAQETELKGFRVTPPGHIQLVRVIMTFMSRSPSREIV